MRRPQNLKKSPTYFDKTAVFTQQCQNKWKIFQIVVAFSEKLDFIVGKTLQFEQFFQFFWRVW